MGHKMNQSGQTRYLPISRFYRSWLLLVIIGLGLRAFGQAGLEGLPMRGDGWRNTGPTGQVKVELVSQYEAVAPSQKFGIAVVLEVAQGWHLYPNPDLRESGYPTEILPYSSPYFRFGKVFYPKGDSYKDPLLNDTYNVYRGRTIIYVPVEVLHLTTTEWPGRVKMRFRLKGLTCDESVGTCQPWQDETSIEIDLVPEQKDAKPNRPELFAGMDLSKVDWEEDTVLQPDSSVPPSPQAADKHVMPDYEAREWKNEGIAAGDWIKPILLGLIAGFLLNLMPCVLPVIPLKVLSLIQQSQADAESGDRFKAVKLSLVFSAGILLVFISLAVVFSVFKIMYGQQFQSDAFKFVMLMIIFVLGLSMLGLFEIVLPGKVTNVQIVREGYVGALGMGVLATLLATPCSAPLLGPVLTWSLSKPTIVTVVVFIVVGIGMAAPYVILTAFPKLLQKIPKAGTWMIRLKEALGFVMLGVAAYLIFLFPAKWQMPLIVFCLVLALSVWLSMLVVNYASPTRQKLWARGVSLVLLLLGIVFLHQSVKETQASEHEEYSLARLIEYNQQGQNVMVEFTADWCPNCKYVEKMVLQRDKFKQKLSATNTKLLIADLTHFEPEAKKLLEQLGSKSIPFTAIFPGEDYLRPIVLRDIYVLDTVLEVLDTLEE